MTSALMRGHTLVQNAVKKAQVWREKRIKHILNRPRYLLSPKERSEARRLTGRWDFWNYKS